MVTQTKITDVGPAGMLPRGPYLSTENYTLNHVVLYAHDSWICKAMDAQGEAIEISNIAPDDPTYGALYWQALTDGGRAAVAVGQQVRSEFDTWFGATASAGIRKTVSDWLTSVQNAWTNWFGANSNSGVRKTWADWYAGVQSAWASWFGSDANSGVRKTWSDWFANAKTAWTTWFGSNASSGVQKDWKNLSDAVSEATDILNEWNTHTPYIGDGTTGDLNYWYLWNLTTHQYVKGPYAKGDNLSWNEMTQADKDVLVAEMIASLEEMGFATEAECRAIVTNYGQSSE